MLFPSRNLRGYPYIFKLTLENALDSPGVLFALVALRTKQPGDGLICVNG